MTLPATTIVLIVLPSLNADGEKAYSSRGQLFDGSIDGRRIVKRSTTPFCDAARVLLAEGIKPDTILVMRHNGSASDALRASVWAAAKLTVQDAGGPPRFKPWTPYNAVVSGPVSPSIAETGREAAEALFRPGRIPEPVG